MPIGHPLYQAYWWFTIVESQKITLNKSKFMPIGSIYNLTKKSTLTYQFDGYVMGVNSSVFTNKSDRDRVTETKAVSEIS